jgi:hypothetical protein
MNETENNIKEQIAKNKLTVQSAKRNKVKAVCERYLIRGQIFRLHYPFGFAQG